MWVRLGVHNGEDDDADRWVPVRDLPKTVRRIKFPAWGACFILDTGDDIVVDFLENKPSDR